MAFRWRANSDLRLDASGDEEFYFSSSEFRVRKASFEREKRVSSKKSEFRVITVSFELEKRVSSKKGEFRVRKASFE